MHQFDKDTNEYSQHKTCTSTSVPAVLEDEPHRQDRALSRLAG